MATESVDSHAIALFEFQKGATGLNNRGQPSRAPAGLRGMWRMGKALGPRHVFVMFS